MSLVKAVRIHAYGGAEQLRYEDIPKPAAAAGEVLVSVHAAAVNPVDYKVRTGFAKGMFAASPLPTALGGDIAGIVEAVGEGVTAFAPGDEVIGMIGLIGAYAEYVAVNAQYLTRKPRGLDFVQAASLPLVGLTAWQALFDAAQLQAGQSVLIHAAAGGVGTIATQLARWRGAQVTGTGSPANTDYLLSLGATSVIDYRTTPIEAMSAATPDGFDVVIDAIGGDTGTRSLGLLKPGGIVVVVAGRPAPREPDAEGRRLQGVIVQPDGAKLAQIVAAVEAGHLRAEIAKVFALQDVAAAHALIEQGHTRGKIVLQVRA